MKITKTILLCLLFFSIPLSLFSDDTTDMWIKMYERTENPKLKYSVMLNIAALDDRATIPLLEKILVEDIAANLANKRSVSEEKNYIELSKLVIKKLGDFKAVDTAEYIYQVFLNNPDPLLKAECLMALGNMRATEYVDEVSAILDSRNRRPLSGAYSSFETQSESKIAYAAISALDKFGHVDGYSPVFFASIGWYDQRVRNYADKVLLTIIENPIDALIPIIKNGDLESKEKAITEVGECSAPREDKIVAAREALKQGHVNDVDTITGRTILTSIRKKAIYTTWLNRSNKAEDIPYLRDSLENWADLEEAIYSMKALSVNSSEGALDVIISVLHNFNDRYVSGIRINYLEEDVIRSLIETLGEVGDIRAKIVLTEVLYSGYPGGITRKAKEALKKLN